MAIREIAKILDDGELNRIIHAYQEAAMDKSSAGFNIFTIISDKFRHENLHSDVIKVFLDPTEQHKEGALFLCQFIDMLNLKRDSQHHIDSHIYRDAIVERERNHIDILIKSREHDCCIIIENKLNGAQDMQRQLSRYYHEMQQQNIRVDAIVYLTRTEIERPDQNSYEEIEKEDQIKIIIIPATSSNPDDVTLIKDWIDPCIEKSDNIECISIMRQYSRLLKSLFKISKTHQVMSELYEYLNENLSKLDEIRFLSKMLYELPIAMASILSEDLIKKYKEKDKDEYKQNITRIGCIWSKDPDHCVIELKDNFCIYIICHADQGNAYELNVVNWKTDITKMNTINLDMDSDSRGKGRYYKNYRWVERTTMVNDIDKILDKIPFSFGINKGISS